MQAPGGPEEDTSGGFKYGGWMANLGDTMTYEIIDGFMKLDFDLLLGRITYDIFALYWPHVKSDSQIAVKFNAATKYVVSHSIMETPWQNSKLITGDVVAELKKLKEESGPDLWVHGSGELIQTLLAEDLIDTMHVWTFPATIGNGKRLFAHGTKPKAFKLTQSRVTPAGVIIATYEPSGELKTGTIGA